MFIKITCFYVLLKLMNKYIDIKVGKRVVLNFNRKNIQVRMQTFSIPAQLFQ